MTPTVHYTIFVFLYFGKGKGNLAKGGKGKGKQNPFRTTLFIFYHHLWVHQ